MLRPQQQLLEHRPHLCRRDLLQLRHQRLRRTQPAEVEQLLCRRLHAPRRLLQGAQAAHLQLLACARQRHRIQRPLGLALQQRMHRLQVLLGLGRRGGALDQELAVLRQDVGRAGHVVGQAAALADLVQQRRAHALAQQRGGQHMGQVRAALGISAQARRLEAQQDLALAAAGHAPGFQAALPARRAQAIGHGAESLLHQPREGLGIHRPGRRHHHIAGGVLGPGIGQQIRALEALDIGARADDGPARRMARPVAGAVQQQEGHTARVILELAELLLDHTPLALQFISGEAAVQHDIGQPLHKGRQIARQALDMKGGVVLVGVGIDLGAQRLGVEIDALAVALGRALEGHVLHHMADAVQPRALVQAAGANENAQAQRLAPGHGDGDGAQAIGQGGQRGGRCGSGWCVQNDAGAWP